MSTRLTRGLRGALLCSLFISLTGCGLPRSGPYKRELFNSSELREGDAFIVAVDERVTRATNFVPKLGFSSGFLNAGVVGSDTIRAGDTLGMTIYENVDDGLLAAQGVNASVLDEVQVDGAGFIFIPYAGRIKASGNTPERLRQIITEKLQDQTPDPQVVVRRLAGDGATVSVVGAVAGQGVFPIERPTRTLSAMLAQAGGLTIESEIAQVSVIRGTHRGTIWFEDLYHDAKLDIALRGGDRILVEEDSRAFTALGATGAQARVPFDTQELSALEALARVGGLSTNLADPTGIFVLRNEPAAIANTVLNRSDLSGDQRMAYVLNLTEPNGLFNAREFVIRDDDTVYVTEAPYVQWTKTLAVITGSVASAGAVSQASSGL